MNLFPLASLGLSGFTLAMAVQNLKLFCQPPPAGLNTPLVSVCIPARNEEENLADCLTSLNASTYSNYEILVYDDESQDQTPFILAAWADKIRRVPSAPLPDGWNGKQHACHRMAQAAHGDWLLFLDADVRLTPDCLARALAFAHAQKAGLVSTFPRQMWGTAGEALLLSLIPFVLLSYLPLARMRSTLEPNTSAGCGQFMLVSREAYEASGGHQGFAGSSHDGLLLPRAVRRAGFSTDIFDGTDVARVRMYHGFRETWSGLTKNSFEALGSWPALVLVTLLHVAMMAGAWLFIAHPLGALAVVCQLWERTILARRFRQPLWIVLLHPLSLITLSAVQWRSWWLARQGRLSWKGRTL